MLPSLSGLALHDATGVDGDGSNVGDKAKPYKHHGGHSFGPGYGAKKKVSPGDLGKQLTNCNDEKRRLQKQRDDCEEELARTKAQNQSLNEKIARMTMEASSLRQRMQQLAQQKEELRPQLMDRLKTLEQMFRNEAQASDAERARQKAEIRALLEELQSLDARVTQASQELSDSQAELAGQRAVYSQEIQSLEEANAKLQVERNELQVDLLELRANLEVLRAALAEAERALPDGTPADNAVRNAQTQWSDDEMDSFLRNAQEMLDAAAQTEAAVEAAQAEYVQITITVEALETENAAANDELKDLLTELKGLRQSIENQINQGLKEGLEKLSKGLVPAPAPARAADADCDRALGMEPKYNSELFLAIATARPEDAIRLIHRGATLDTGPPRDKTPTYLPVLQESWRNSVFASAVLFEDLRWVGDTLDKYKAGFMMDPFLNGSWDPARPWERGVRYQREEDPERVKAMLPILDALADNPCPLNAGFKFYIPLHVNPINWSPELVEYAYKKGLMPAETTWSLLDGVLLWAHLSPLLLVFYHGSNSSMLRGTGDQMINWTGQEYLAYEKRLMDQAKAMIVLAKRLGQTKIKQGNTRGFASYASSTNYGEDLSKMSPSGLAKLADSVKRDRQHALHDVLDDVVSVLQKRMAFVQKIRAEFGM